MFVIIQLYYTKQCHNVKNKKSIHDDRVGVSDVNSFLSDHTNKTMVNQCLGGKEGGGGKERRECLYLSLCDRRKALSGLEAREECAPLFSLSLRSSPLKLFL